MQVPSARDEIRILYMTGGRRIGGMETHLIALASSLPPSMRPFVCCLDGSEAYLARLAEARIEHADVRWPNLRTPAGIAGYLRLERVIGRFSPHVLHSYGFSADVAAGLLRARGSRARLVTSRRGEDRNRRRQAIRRLVNRVSEKVVCVSAETAAFVRATEAPPTDMLEVIPNGVRLAETDALPRIARPGDPIRFGTLGTVKPIKGTDLLVDAFMKFDSDRRVELVVAGLVDRPWAEALRRHAQSDPRITFAGRAPGASAFLAGIDVFVLPSRSEGMSNALLEAMAAGVPCIATDVGSNRSLLGPSGEPPAGLITEASAESLFRAMSELETSAEMRDRYGARGASVVREKYTIPGMVTRYERLYRSVIGQASMPGDVVPTRCVTD